MGDRPYSARRSAAWIFMDLLSEIGRRGWFGAGPSADDGMALLYVSFHVHPEDADRIFLLVQEGIRCYGGETEWVIDRLQQNRFIIYPIQLEMKAREVDDFQKATEIIRNEFPSQERDAARDIIVLSDVLYQLHLKRKGEG